MADGYGAYDALARASPGFTLAHCWAHVRRKYVEAEPRYPGPCRAVLDLIGRLYAIEAQVPALSPGATAEERAATRTLRACLRAEQSREIVGEIRAWALGQRVLPESSLGKAITYMLGLWAGLTRFLNDPRIPIDNNHTERGLRGVVLGLPAGDRGRRPVLQPHRVGEALRRGPQGVPAAGSACGTSHPWNRHAPPHSARLTPSSVPPSWATGWCPAAP